ncbi:MAG TPA: urease accessory protein UreD [Casimicrobiaceae bacterium]|jgi:urease accessory protein|nr:urease accessory protein UreD [Casimicrobiaceae bacterium]
MTSVARALARSDLAPRIPHAPRPSASRWRAELRLRFERSGPRTVLAERFHVGPLRVQKSLYAEGHGVCQNIIVHPPGGIVGGDALVIDASAGPAAHAQLTTPGAAKWYRSAGAPATQHLFLRAAEAAVIEWLPRETIVYDGAIAELDTRIELALDAVFIGWDIVCLGRTASGERFRQGSLRQQLSLSRDGAAVYVERARVDGGGRLMSSPVGLNGATVFGTFIAAAPKTNDTLLEACRKIVADGEGAVTRLPGVLLARYRGASVEPAHAYFERLWRLARPQLTGRDAIPPRIWST